MNYLARLFTSVILLSCLTAPCWAQGSKRISGPPPAAAVEYDDKAWKEFSSAEGGFSILMPGTPQAKTQEVASPPGKVSFRTFELRTNTGVYDVSYSDLPIYSEDPAHISEGLDANRDALLKSTGLKLLSEKAITFDGVPGREWLLVGNEGVVRRRIIIVKDRLYTLSFVTAPNVAFNSGRPSADPAERTDFYEATAAKFFDSFKVTPRQAAANARRVEDELAARSKGQRKTDPPTLGRRDVDAAPEVTRPEGEVDRLVRELRERGEVIYGRCGEGDECVSVPNSTLVISEPISRPLPEYPAIAKAARVQGEVRVLLVVDEEGKVIAAQALSGHPLLQSAAVKAARQVIFRPALLNDRPVKISGVLSYNFNLQ